MTQVKGFYEYELKARWNEY
jgi:hypothetical protein